jgi:hypothetical protein
VRLAASGRTFERKVVMKIVELVRVTLGRHHGWCKTDVGTLVRKPLGQKLFQHPILPRVRFQQKILPL